MESANYYQKGKRLDESKSETTIIMLPSDANPRGNVFGGVILKHLDLIAGLVAKRHAGHANIVTASIDRMTFLKPVYIGNALILSARLNYVKRSSMEVEVTIEAEDLDIGERVLTGTAFVTVVALDEHRKRRSLPRLVTAAAVQADRAKRDPPLQARRSAALQPQRNRHCAVPHQHRKRGGD